MRRLEVLEKYNKYLPYIAVLTCSLAVGVIIAGKNPEYTRALATWLTMTFAGIGLYIGINKYGLDLEAKASQDLHIMTSMKDQIYCNVNGRQTKIEVFKIEFQNDSQKHATISIPKNFNSDIFYRGSPTQPNHTRIWDSNKKEILDNRTETFIIRSSSSKQFSFTENGDSYPKLGYYFGDDSKNEQYITLALL